MSQRVVRVPTERLDRWCANFEARHGPTAYASRDGSLRLDAADGSHAVIRPPFGRQVPAGAATLEAVSSLCAPPEDWAVLLVRKGGFAVARLHGAAVVARKVGQRHVQGRTKAGGQSQQRFARRRDNQARAAYEAAAGHAVERLTGPDVAVLVTGGDRAAVEAVLEDSRLAGVRAAVAPDWLDVPDPRGAVLDDAILAACAPTIEVTNA